MMQRWKCDALIFAPILFLILLSMLLAGPAAVIATQEEEYEIDLSHVIEVQLGSETNQMRFFPGQIVMRQGERYLLVLTNPSPVTHEFASEALSSHIQTEKLKVLDREGNLVAYVVGDIQEVELLPFGRIEWAFVTTMASSTIDLFCDIPGHRAAGMVGEIQIVNGR